MKGIPDYPAKNMESFILGIIRVYVSAELGHHYAGRIVFNHKGSIVIMDGEKRNGQDTADYINEAFHIFKTYFTGRLKISLLLGIVCYIVLYLMEIKFKGLISVIVATANLLPYLGPVIGMVLSALIVVLQGPVLAVWVILLNLGLQLLDSFIFSPAILGKSLGLSPFTVLTVILIGGILFNVWGVILAVPVAALINTLLKKETKK